MPFLDLPDTFQTWSQQHPLYHKIDPIAHSWLLDSDSLTQRIIKQCEKYKRSFSVEVLQQYIGKASISEASRLNMESDQAAHIREVLLHCGKTPVVYAKTIIPLTSLTGKQQQLALLGNKPLGAYLFSQPNLLRDDIEVSQLEYQQQQLWARRSAFYLEAKPLLVYEVFLPELFKPKP